MTRPAYRCTACDRPVAWRGDSTAGRWDHLVPPIPPHDVTRRPLTDGQRRTHLEAADVRQWLARWNTP